MRRFYLGVFVLLLAAAVLVGCGGSKQQTQTTTPTPQAANVYVTGQDAPLPSVLAFTINIDTLKLSNSSGTVTLENPGNVEFSRLLGLRTLLSLSSVPAGTYTDAQVTFSSPSISYLDTSVDPPVVRTMAGTLGSVTVSSALNPPLVVDANGLGGLTFHFDLHNSLMMSGGQMTGTVNPSIQIRALTINDPDAEVDELRGGVVSVDATNKLFVLQRPNGRNINVRVDNNTDWEGPTTSESLSTIAPPTTVEVSGKIQADGSILADAVEVLTHDRAFISGLILDVNPATGNATDFTLLARQSLPAIPGVSVPGTAQINVLSGSTNTVFDIRKFNLPVETFLFNRSMLVVGQRVAIGGTINSTTTPNSVDARRVVLRRQGLDGVPGGVQVNNGNTGTFLLQNNGLFGDILGGNALKVTTSNTTVFKNVGGLAGVANATRVRVVGLVLKDSGGNPVMVAGYVEKLQ